MVLSSVMAVLAMKVWKYKGIYLYTKRGRKRGREEGKCGGWWSDEQEEGEGGRGSYGLVWGWCGWHGPGLVILHR
jgi:hypothetical protein